MDETQTWQARHEALSARLCRIGEILGDRSKPAGEREAASSEFITTWQEFTQHIKQQPIPLHR
jgi:hypothetical protein